LFRLANISL